jgi:hypothetical protein
VCHKVYRGDRPDSDDASVGCHMRRRVRGVGEPGQGDVVVLSLVALISRWWLRSKSSGSAAAVAAVITPQQLIAAATIMARVGIAAVFHRQAKRGLPPRNRGAR